LGSNNTDIALWEAFRKGDSESFGLLFRKYYEPLFQYGSKLTRDEELLEDCIQELFTELWQNKSQTEVLFVKAYLFKSLKYKIFRHLQKKSAGRASEDLNDSLFELSHETFLVSKEENDERSARIIEAMNQLTNRQKEIIYLKLYQELSYEEVNEIMNINYQVARNLFSQSIKSLRKLLIPLKKI
jgi:RNA polymerase sigma factor (sigma-70 family)